MKAATALEVVIPTLADGPSPVLDACLASLARQTAPASGIVVVGDGGRPRVPPGVRLLALPGWRGFAACANRGIADARERGAELILLLNDDTVATPEFLESLRRAASERPDVALFSPKILYPGEPPRIWWAGGDYSLWLGVPRHYGRKEPDGPRHSRERRIRFATGCALLARAAALRTLGPLREDLLAYGEDVDLSIRAAKERLPILYVPRAVLVHRVEEPGRRAEGEAWRIQLNTANLLRVLAAHASPWHWLTAVPWICVRWAGWIALRSIVDGELRSLRAVGRGLADFARSPRRATAFPGGTPRP